MKGINGNKMSWSVATNDICISLV